MTQQNETATAHQAQTRPAARIGTPAERRTARLALLGRETRHGRCLSAPSSTPRQQLVNRVTSYVA